VVCKLCSQDSACLLFRSLKLQQLYNNNNNNNNFFFFFRHMVHIIGTVAIRKTEQQVRAKLHTVVASNNKDHTSFSVYICLFVPHVYVCLFFTHIPFMVNCTFNATPMNRLHQHNQTMQEPKKWLAIVHCKTNLQLPAQTLFDTFKKGTTHAERTDRDKQAETRQVQPGRDELGKFGEFGLCLSS